MSKNLVMSMFLLFVVSVANANVVTYNFSGVITKSESSFVDVDALYSLNISWDTTTSPDIPGNYPSAITAFVGSVGSHSFLGAENLTSANGQNAIAVGKNALIDFNNNVFADYVIYAADFTQDNVRVAGQPISGFFLALYDDVDLSNTDTSLVTSLFIDDFELDISIFTFAFSDLSLVEANIDTITEISAVPVPATLWFFVSGLVGLLGFSRELRFLK